MFRTGWYVRKLPESGVPPIFPSTVSQLRRTKVIGVGINRAVEREKVGEGKIYPILPRQKNQMNALKRWLEQWFSQDRRKADRQPLPGLVAYYWTGSVSVGKNVRDISAAGLYLLTEDRWYPGTMIKMTLQRTGKAGENLEECSIVVHAKVVRTGADGVGLAFISPDTVELWGHNSQNVAGKKALLRFLQALKNT